MDSFLLSAIFDRTSGLKVLQLLREAAQKGDARSQMNVGFMFANGHEIKDQSCKVGVYCTEER